MQSGVKLETREVAGTRCHRDTWFVTMTSMHSPRFFAAVVLAVVLSALAGGFFGSGLLATQDDVAQQYRVFTSALSAIEREYVDEVPSDRLVYGAIDGMLKTLDPHSSFFDPRSYAQMRERQE